MGMPKVVTRVIASFVLGGSVSMMAPGTASAAPGDGSSLPSVETGARPGPDLLYTPQPVVPQLENTGPWRAKPILVSGASAYRDGEFVHQDYLYDDHGNSGLAKSSNISSAYTFATSKGVLTYPTDPVFANNAADLVEFRVKPLAQETAFRVTLNSLVDPQRSAFTVAIGAPTDTASVPWPAKAGVSSTGQFFLTVHGNTATLTDAKGATVTPAPRVSVDLTRRQFDVRIPHRAWNPSTKKVRFATGVGLWDTQLGHYLQPQDTASATHPGGKPWVGGQSLFDVAFQRNETGSWRDDLQSAVLDARQLYGVSTTVDFGKLADGVRDDSGVPQTGVLNRILPSRFGFGQGLDLGKKCKREDDVLAAGGCEGILRGQLQPYRVEIPDKPRPAAGWSLTLMLHALEQNHNLWMLEKYGAQLAADDAGSIVVTPSGRGPDGDYRDHAEADFFEVWADVARHYQLAPGRTTITGFSMGAGGAFSLPMRWPDLFARSAGAAAVPGGNLESLRNVPVMAWIGLLDEGTLLPRQLESVARLEKLGLRYRFDFFIAEHLTLALNDFQPMADWLGDPLVDPNPRRVTYVVDPKFDYDLVTDHAYWLSELSLRESGPGVTGKVNAVSATFGTADPATKVSFGPTLFGGGSVLPSYRSQLDWLVPATTPQENKVDLDLGNLETVTVDGPRARLNCETPLTVQVKSDGASRVRLDLPLSGKVVATDGAGRPAPEVELSRAGAVFPVAAGTSTYVLTCLKQDSS